MVRKGDGRTRVFGVSFFRQLAFVGRAADAPSPATNATDLTQREEAMCERADSTAGLATRPPQRSSCEVGPADYFNDCITEYVASHTAFIDWLQSRCNKSLSPEDVTCIMQLRERLGYTGSDPQRTCTISSAPDLSDVSSMITLLLPYLHHRLQYERSDTSAESAESAKPILFLVCDREDTHLAQAITRDMNLCVINSRFQSTQSEAQKQEGADVVLVGYRDILARRTYPFGGVKSTIKSVQQEKCKLQIDALGNIQSHCTLAIMCNLLRKHFLERPEFPIYLRCMKDHGLDRILVPTEENLSHRPIATVPAFTPDIASALLALCNESSVQVPAYIRQVLDHLRLGGDPKHMLNSEIVRQTSFDRRYERVHIAFYMPYECTESALYIRPTADVLDRMVSLIHPELRVSTVGQKSLSDLGSTITLVFGPNEKLPDAFPEWLKDQSNYVRLTSPASEAVPLVRNYWNTLQQRHPRSAPFDSRASVLQVTRVDRRMSIADILSWTARRIHCSISDPVCLVGGTRLPGQTLVDSMRQVTFHAIIAMAMRFSGSIPNREHTSFVVAKRLINNFIVHIVHCNAPIVSDEKKDKLDFISDSPQLIEDIIRCNAPTRLRDDVGDFWLGHGMERLTPEELCRNDTIDMLDPEQKRHHLMQSNISYFEFEAMVRLRMVGRRLMRECDILDRNLRDWIRMWAMCHAVHHESLAGNSTVARNALQQALSTWQFTSASLHGSSECESLLQITAEEVKYMQALLHHAGLTMQWEPPANRLASEDALTSMLRAHQTSLQKSYEATCHFDGLHNQVTINMPATLLPYLYTMTPCTVASLPVMRQFVARGMQCKSHPLSLIRANQDLVQHILMYACCEPPSDAFFDPYATGLSKSELNGVAAQPIYDIVKGFMGLTGSRCVPFPQCYRAVGPMLSSRMKKSRKGWDIKLKNDIYKHDQAEKLAYAHVREAEASYQANSETYILADYTHPTSCTQHILCQATDASSIDADIRVITSANNRHIGDKSHRHTNVILCSPRESQAFADIRAAHLAIFGDDHGYDDAYTGKVFADLAERFCPDVTFADTHRDDAALSFCVTKTPDRRAAPSMNQLLAQFPVKSAAYHAILQACSPYTLPRPLSVTERHHHMGGTCRRIIAAIRRCIQRTSQPPKNIAEVKSILASDQISERSNLFALNRLERTENASACFENMVKAAGIAKSVRRGANGVKKSAKRKAAVLL